MKTRTQLAAVLRGVAESSVLTVEEADDLDTIASMLESNTRLAIVIEGGVVQAVVSDAPETLGGLDIAVIDYDTDGMDDDQIVQVIQSDGSTASADVTHPSITKAEIGLDEVFAVEG
ncbi:hypothetical protein [Magnetospirillum molischianum]|uniref:Uncharacterized protein n=1 Tax=Magnetospirillum molischianum DSM 120 TaxID=1150626 RepID=H8FXY0_MAGML|nr:hypothetical protein [Magnetospirillum molischianum]CCG43218.1 hypothetical protein PHAMO_80009 [Magnetospirillum molischianum DSM 120]